MKQILSITRKELEGYFGSPLAIIFLGTFLAVVLFTFFTVEKFFARGIADVRPMFQWLPILLIFLLAALTMRQWSDEKRSGSIEILLTMPVSRFQLVMGKFLAVMAFIGLALLLTLPIPITVSRLGNLDWGPVAGGYLAAFLMAGAYAAIGLFISSRTDNQIVALISTMIVGGLFYLVGTRSVTDFFNGSLSNLFWAIGTGSRFESIERGVIDLRDLVYYLSLTGIFLLLNTLSLDMPRWSKKQKAYRVKSLISAGLIGFNLLAVNVWMYPLHGLRLDLTESKEYTISQVTKDLITNLDEPLLIRAYISKETHPLLAPLGPQVEDMIREYEIASNGMVQAEVLDPLDDPEAEAEANNTYGIKPSPFQVTGKNETSIINSYFDILIRYGDQSVTLGYGDLIEIVQSSGSAEVKLRNLEYDLDKAIKKVLYGFQSVDSVLAALEDPVHLTFYVTPDMLPEELAANVDVVKSAAENIAETSNGKLVFEMIDPDAAGSSVTRDNLIQNLQLQPFALSLYSDKSFFMHLVLQHGEETKVIYPIDEGLTTANVHKLVEEAIKQTSTGFLKVVGYWHQDLSPTTDMFGQTIQAISSYDTLAKTLGSEYTVQSVDLTSGSVPTEVDVLVMIAPQGLDDLELFAVDQFLMRGGSLVIADSNYKAGIDPYYGGLSLMPVEGGMKDMLSYYGIDVSDAVVLDTQNEPFPVYVSRDVNGTTVQEIQYISYPFYPDIRAAGMNTKSSITSNLSAVTMNWASPVTLNAEKNANRETETLLYSSADSWTLDNPNIQPDFTTYPETGFEVSETKQAYPLAVAVKGVFNSYFTDKPSPFEAKATEEADSNDTAIQQEAPASTAESYYTRIDQSPDTARIVVFGSATFIDDFVFDISSSTSQDRYLNSLQFFQNAVDWTVEDSDLLTIRSKGSQTRVLDELDENQENFWEMLNYGVALFVLIGIFITWQYDKRHEKPLSLIPREKLDKGGRS
ncbi:MAG: Gldg family protein [Chloroflexi bacterium]|nr:Gldg family protein [Chloroflexota bacterium]